MNNKMESSAVLQFYFGCHSEDISEFVVFMPLSPHNNLDDFKKLCDEVRKEFSTGDSSGFVGSQEDYPVTFIGTGIGSSQVGDATLALAYSQCKVAIFVGSVGGLDDDMNIGDIVVVEEAVIGEGFSRYHQSQTPSEDMFGKIVQADDLLIDYLWRKVQSRAQSFDVMAHKGRIFTTESILAETEQFLQEIGRGGCIGIEKEISAFYTAAKETKIKAAAVLCISDLPLHQKSLFVSLSKEEKDKRTKVRHEIIPQIVLELAAGCYCLDEIE